MASNAELVPIRVPKVGAIVIGMVLRAKPRQAFAGAAVCQGDLMRRPNSGPGRSCEPNHLAVPGMMRLPVIGLANDKEWALPVCAMPSRPRLVRLTEPHFDAKAVHDGTVEIQGPVEIADAHENMRKHVGSLVCLKGDFWPIVVPHLGLYSVGDAYPVLLGLIVLDRIDARHVSMDAVGP